MPNLRTVLFVIVGGGCTVAAQAQLAAPSNVALFDAAHVGCSTGATSTLSAFRPLPSRSPGGLLYARPPFRDETADDAHWSVSGCVEFGAQIGDNDESSALFRKYRDPGGRAPRVDVFSLAAEAPSGGPFFELGGNSIGRHDQDYVARTGRYNAWSLAATYGETPHLLADSFRSLWDGVGSDRLRLAGPVLMPGGLGSEAETQTALREVLAGTPKASLQVIRKKGGIELNARPAESWRAFLSLASERRRGARPLGAVFGGGDGGGNIDVPQSIDDASHEISAGASYADALTSLNVVLSASLYRNRIGSMTFDNPLRVMTNTIAGIDAGAFAQGRFAADPDNDYLSAKLDLARAFPDWLNARVTASLALGRLRQNEALLAPTFLPLTGATLNGVAADGVWNTPAALTRSHAKARIDTQLAVLGVSLQPARDLALSGRLRDERSDNATEYLACNPQTGQLGRLLNDGSGAALLAVPQYLAARCDLAAIRALDIAPDAGNITLRNTPFEQHSRTYGVTADWRLRPRGNLTAELERNETRRHGRERDRTEENRLKLSYGERGLPNATLRATVEYAERGGSDYRSDAQFERISASLGPLPTAGNVSTWFGAVDQLRKFDLADRTRAKVHLRADFAVGEGLDVGASLSASRTRYPHSEIGRNGRERHSSIGLDANYVAGDGLSLHAFYTVQASDLRYVGTQPAGCLIGVAGVTAENFRQCGVLGGPLFPGDRLWAAESEDVNHVVGAGGRFEFGWGVLDFDYTYSRARTSIGYAHGDGIFLSPERAALAANGWPDLRFRQSVLAASAWIPLRPRLSLRLRFQFEQGKVDDWHYAGLAANPVPLANTVYLASAPQRYQAAFAGILLRLAL